MASPYYFEFHDSSLEAVVVVGDVCDVLLSGTLLLGDRARAGAVALRMHEVTRLRAQHLREFVYGVGNGTTSEGLRLEGCNGASLTVVGRLVETLYLPAHFPRCRDDDSGPLVSVDAVSPTEFADVVALEIEPERDRPADEIAGLVRLAHGRADRGIIELWGPTDLDLELGSVEQPTTEPATTHALDVRLGSWARLRATGGLLRAHHGEPPFFYR